MASEAGSGGRFSMSGRPLLNRQGGRGHADEERLQSREPQGAEESYQRQVEAQIAQYAEGVVHGLAPIAHWFHQSILRPRIRHVFAADNLHDLYARQIAIACARSGCNLAISLGSGDGAVEVAILLRSKALGLPAFRMECVELSPLLAARAREAGRAAGLGEQFAVVEADLNRELPVRGPVGAFMAHHALHHVVELEKLFSAVEALLAPQGVFVTGDMIGRNGHMRWPETLGPLRELWPLLPERLTWNNATQEPDLWLENTDCSIEGFEGIRAQDILPLLVERFSFERFLAWGGLTDLFIERSFGPNLDPAELVDQLFLERLQRVEDFSIATGYTKPTIMLAAMRKRRGKRPDDEAATRCYGNITPSIAIRLPDAVVTAPSLRDIGFASPYPLPAPRAVATVIVGETIGFGLRDKGRELLRWGWAASEEGYTWATGLESALGLVTSGRGARSITLVTMGYVAPDHDCQRVTVSLDGAEIGEIVHKSSGSVVSTRLAFPDEFVAGHLRILEFRSARPRRPALDGGPDRRPITFALISVLVE